MKYKEFLEFIDGLIDYEEIIEQYGLTYTQIDAAITEIKDTMGARSPPDASQPKNAVDGAGECGCETVENPNPGLVKSYKGAYLPTP